MATPRKVGGYADRYEINRAIRANRDARRTLGRILEIASNRRGSAWIYPLVADLAQAHSTALEALFEIEKIREEVKQ